VLPFFYACYYGFFALLSNEKMDSIAALELYRNKDLLEKAFGNLNERLNLRRTADLLFLNIFLAYQGLPDGLEPFKCRIADLSILCLY